MIAIGFYIKWDKFSLTNKGNVVGDELLAESLAKAINQQYPHIQAQTYAPNFLPTQPLDAMIYLNEVEEILPIARKNIFYFQNGFPDTQTHFPTEYIHNFDALFCFSQKMLDEYAHKISIPYIYVPFGVDTDLFFPREEILPQSPQYAQAQHYKCDVAYIGNDIKGEEATMRYLYPALNFDFGLFGNWHIPRSRFKLWKNFKKLSPYQKPFERISRGKIPQEWVPYLYSNTKINLNCTMQSCIEWDVITLRTLEVLACKGFLISDKVPSATTILKDCLVFTEGGNDLIEKIRYYLDNQNKARKIAQKGYEYVTQHCTINQRANDIINFLQKDVL